jgi:foldase protein PrsA
VRAALANPSKRQLSKWQRERRQRLWILGAAGALVALAVVILAFGYWREMIARPNEPVAVVGEEVIPSGALVQRLKPHLAALDQELVRLQSQAPVSRSGTGQQDSSARQMQMLQSQRMNAPDQVLGDMIDEELIRLEALRRGITVTSQEIDARIQRDLARPRAAADDASGPQAAAAAGAQSGTPTPTVVPTLTADEFEKTYASFLDAIGFTDQQFRAYIEAQLLRDKVRDVVAGDIQRVQEQVHARRHVVAMQEEATAALAQIRSGQTTFEDLAREKSLDLTSKNSGGDLGWLPRGIESTQFDEAAFRLAPGEIGEPVVTPQGWEIIQVLEKAPRALSDEHLDRMRARAMDQWLRQARDDPSVRRELTKERRDWVLRQANAQGGRRGSAASDGGLTFGY